MNRSLFAATLVCLLVAACTSASTEGTTTLPGSPSTTSTAPPTTTTRPVDVGSLFGLGAPDIASIEAAAAQIDDPLPEALRAAYGYEEIPAGRSGAAAPIGFGMTRQMVVRTPAGYMPDESWPLIVAYHGWGGEADVILDRMEKILGDSIEQFVVAAPDDFRQTVIDAPPPVTSEHLSLWRGVRSEWNIDSDRVYLAGYSLGGDTVITLASMHPGHIAGGLSMAAGAAYPTDVDGLAELFWSQLRPIPIVQVVGGDDDLNIVGLNGRPQDITNVGQAELIAQWATDLGLHRYTQRILEGVGHSGAHPDVALALAALSSERPEPPTSFTHHFRYIHQADVWWVEGHEWTGDAWLTAWPEVAPHADEDDEAALARTIDSLLGSIDAHIEGQTVSVDTSHLGDYTVWFHDGMIDWSSPITLVANGSVVYEGVVERSKAIAISQAVRTLDFDRLRYAGIRVDPQSGTATLVTPGDDFPPTVRGITF